MPKAPAFPEDEKTTLESGWEEEPSTTVEQGDVAEKIRAIQAEPARGRHGMSNITSTGNSVLDEPTVDDQRANAVIAMLAPPGPAAARMLVTQGNDTGQHLELAPGKSYTIGRAIDNDFVLTDIAVSRKHFDLRQEAAGWVLVDRGSGNGTLINGTLEDQPFALANGDVIEIGNTSFRFEHANAPPRIPRPIAGRYDVEVDEEEPSTVAGKPARHDELATPAQGPPPPRLRPKTVPPPAPRMRNPAPSTAPPSVGPNGMRTPAVGGGLPGMPPHLARTAMPGEHPRPLGQHQPPPHLAQPQMLPPPPLAPMPQQMMPQQPQMTPQQMMPQQPQMMPQQMMPQQPQMMPQQPSGPRPPQGQPVPASTRPMPHLPQRPARPSPMGPMGPQAPTMLAADAMSARPSTLPTTIPGQGPPAAPMHPQLPYSYPSVADIQKHAQMLVVGNGQPRDATSTALVQPTPFGVVPTVQSAPMMVSAAPAVSRKTKLLLAGAALTLLAAIATIAIMKGAESKGAEAPSSSGEREGSAPLTAPEPARPEPVRPEPAKVAKVEPAKLAKVEPARPEPARPEPARPEPARPEPARPEPARPEPAKLEPARPEPAKPEPAKPEPAKPEPARPTKDPKKPLKPATTRTTTTRTRPQVATASRADTSGVRNRAIELYRQKKFSEAAAVLSQYASTISGTEASDLRTAASVYQQLGVAYNRGMAPAAKPVDAYNDLRRALNLDSGGAAGELTSEIRTKLAQIAPKAAMSFYVRKDYAQAFQAVRTAEGNGITNSDTALVRDKLEQAAKDIYDAAAREINANPDAAKQKLRQIKGMVDGRSPTLAKANQLLSGS